AGSPAAVVPLPPPRPVAEQPSGLVVEVVAGGKHVEAAGERRGIEVVALHRSAGGARRPPAGGGDGGHPEPGTLGLELHHAKREGAAGGEPLHLLLRGVGVLADAETEVEARRVVAEVDEHVPQREAVLAPRDRDQDALAEHEHVLRGDRSLHLTAEVEEVAGPAEGRVVRPELDLGAFAAPFAFHAAPPEMTARISTSSPSSTTSASVRRRSPRITMAVPGRIPRSVRSAPTRRGPRISTVRCCGRRWTRMARKVER